MKKALSVIFLTVLCVLFFGTFCSGYFTDLRTMFSGYGGGLKGLILTVMEKDYLDERLNKDVFRHDNWIDLYGGALRLTGVCSLREDDGKHIVRTAGDRLAFVWAQRRPSAQQTEWIRSLRKAALETGADCWYVSIPQKTCPTETVYCDRGAANHSEETDRAYAAVFEDAGYRVLDLHARMHADGLRHEALYYRTDHHWTDSTAFWAAGVAAQEIGLPTEHMDPDLYETEVFPKSFLGSEGKHLGRLYVGMDDFELRIPRFATRLTQTSDGEHPRAGTFSDALFYREYLTRDTFKDSMYGAYLGGDKKLVRIRNELLPRGKRILLFKDSFGNSMASYLAPACGQLDLIDPRFYDGSSVLFAQQGKYDVIVVATTYLDLGKPD